MDRGDIKIMYYCVFWSPILGKRSGKIIMDAQIWGNLPYLWLKEQVGKDHTPEKIK